MYNSCIIYNNQQGERMAEKFTITKKIAKHGSQAIIVIPKILQESLKPDTIVKLNIEVLRR